MAMPVVNAILSGCGFNLRKLLRAFFLFIFQRLFWSKIDHPALSNGLYLNQIGFGIKLAQVL
jgi:outer membrane lipopolysaccharide assembly protein LptE/RlpB